MSDGEWKYVDVGKVKFRVPHGWELHKKIGSGAFGTLASFKCSETEQKLAIKKITDAFCDLVDGHRIVCELKLLRALEHDNLNTIVDMYPPDSPDFNDVYIVTQCMDTDLGRVIRSKQVLTDEHHQYFNYQVLRGLLYLHSVDVVHCDLKPSNLLVNRDCYLKICNFGEALIGGSSIQEPLSPRYVTCTWYKAPEKILLAPQYTKSVDMWSVGLILCEMLGRKPIFTGRDLVDQVRKIFAVIGTPATEDLDWLPACSPAQKFMKKFLLHDKQAWSSIYPMATASCVEVMDRLLELHPVKRATVQEALALPYFAALHMPEDEPTAEKLIDCAFDKLDPTKRLLQNQIYVECAEFRPDIYTRDAQLLDACGIKERRRVPLQLAAQVKDGCVAITCANLAGEVLYEFADMALEQPVSVLAELVHERIPSPPGARWQIVWPNANCLDQSQLDATLCEMLEM